ncbi:MAG: hypothetical protein AAGJ83_04305 [Planctomycetota bacterium]
MGAVFLVSPAVAQRVAYEQSPINYLDAEVNDRIAALAKRIDNGDVVLKHEPEHGYLRSVLAALDVPISSQTLVFSKTSLQLQRISPRRPRALYFNDDVYVGFCQRGDVLEFAATDADQGATFYTLSQEETAKPTFVRDRGGCLTCHASSRTQGVPGYLVRSVFADAAGRPKFASGSFTTDHTSRFEDRWGGWYVTGRHGSMRHMGNVICKGDETTFDRELGANQLDLSPFFRIESYLAPTSDVVALMVLEHQTQMHNAIAAANYETRLALHQSYEMNALLDRPAGFISDSAQRRISSAADQVLRYLLFCEEFRLTDPVTGSNQFADEFQQRGVRDSAGRSLRDLDLQTRLFKYPCSYLIHSESFAALPVEVKSLVFQRLDAILRGNDTTETYSHLSVQQRRVIQGILRETLPDFESHRDFSLSGLP